MIRATLPEVKALAARLNVTVEVDVEKDARGRTEYICVHLYANEGTPFDGFDFTSFVYDGGCPDCGASTKAELYGHCVLALQGIDA